MAWAGLAALGASVLLHPFPVSASPGTTVSETAPVFHGCPGCIYAVQPGDTVWNLAKRFGFGVDALTRVNGLASDHLETGQTLLLPDGGTYTVQPGDTVWNLARRFDVSVDALNKANALTSDHLETGQVLRLPGWTAPVAGTSTAFDLSSGEVSRGGGYPDQMAAYALRFQGVPYAFGGATPQAFDCSGFVRYVLAAFGIHVEHSTYAQYRLGVPVTDGRLEPGDLLFFNTYGSLSHDGIYLGDGRFISATDSHGVAVASLDDAYWGPRYAGARRL